MIREMNKLLSKVESDARTVLFLVGVAGAPTELIPSLASQRVHLSVGTKGHQTQTLCNVFIVRINYLNIILIRVA